MIWLFWPKGREEELRTGLGVLEEWFSEWAMKVNAGKVV